MSVKRKAEDSAADEDDTHGSTLFISNLSYNTTTETLQAAFSDIAPVRSCFVVYEKPSGENGVVPAGPGKSKGVGYVTFAVKEDAESTANVYNVDVEGGAKPLMIDGRKVRVKWADRKPLVPNDPSAVPAAPIVKKPRKEPRVSLAQVTNDPAAIRTLKITSLPKGLTKATLWKKIRKYEGAESVEWPVNDDSDLAHAIFKTPAQAASALPKLHSHVFKSSTLSVALKKRVDSLLKNSASNGKTNAALNPSRGGRVIVRNLPWNITEADLRALFTPCGPIHSVTIPTEPSPNPDKPPLARGFAFVWFLSKPDAARAVERVNGSKIYGGFAADKATAAAHKIAGRKELTKKKNEESARVVAVDWALSKDKWVEGQAGVGEVEGDASDSEADGAVGVHGGSSASGSGSDSESGSEHGSDSDIDTADDDDSSMQNGEKRAGPPPPEEGTTLFVRNLPFEATDENLRDLFRAFGPLRYARVTMDHNSGRSRGTGFACFWNLADADKCVEEAERMKADLDPELIAKKNPFTLLTLDPSSSRAARLVLQGRTLDVSRAVSRNQAEKLREVGERQRERKDTRNLYLMREGVIFASTPSASTLSPSELDRRQQAFDARRTLLRSNPSLYISRTRLSVRQLPTFVSERVLKRLAMHAVRAFEDEAARGDRAPLGDDEREENQDPALNGKSSDVAEAAKSTKKSTFWKKGERKTGVKQAKIVRQGDRVDPLTGKGRSKGYGFLEMEKHEDALRVLRWANNNREAPALMWGWWKEELVDLAERGKKDIRNAGKTSEKAGEEKEKGKNVAPTDDKEVLEARLKRQLTKLEEMGTRPSAAEEGGKDGRTVLIEFSIENVQVVKRRSGKEEEAREGGRGDRKGKTRAPDLRNSASDSTKSLKDQGRDVSSRKLKTGKRRVDEDEQDDSTPAESTATPNADQKKPKTKKDKVLARAGTQKAGQKLGGIIGKKRKERRTKAGGGK